MTWARLDDLYDDNRKVKRAWRASGRAVGLHAMAISYCARHETNGLVDVEWITEKLPAARERERVLDVLVAAGLFDAVDAGHFQVHDYLDYNPSRGQLEDKRRKDSERKSRGRDSPVRSDSTRSPNGIRVDATATPHGFHAESARPVPSRPVPTPPPAPPTGGRHRDLVAFADEVATWAAEHFPDAKASAVNGLLSAARSHDRPIAGPQDLEQYARHRGAVWVDALGLPASEPESEDA